MSILKYCFAVVFLCSSIANAVEIPVNNTNSQINQCKERGTQCSNSYISNEQRSQIDDENWYNTDHYDLSDIGHEPNADQEIYDPIESYNRTIFMINKSLDKLVVRPVTIAYKDIVPDWCKDRVHSAVSNMYEPVRLANAILQKDEFKLSTLIGRFLTNTILGLGGLIDIAGEVDESLKSIETDFGLTLKQYGIDKGPYFVLPVLGPSTIRDSIGTVADTFMNPFNYSHLVHRDFIIVRTGVAGLDKRYKLLSVTDNIEEASIDEYSAVRSMYLQQR